ncbi:MAG: type II toxin-antitoxin system death-on-curing family toxin [Hyphomicrobiales bacterium]
MTEPRWLTLKEVIVTHERQLALFGGASGIRDQGLLESALQRPINKWQYEQAGSVELAAAYGFGLARNHPFVDGNKRVAFLSLVGFLRKNGIAFAPSQAEATAIILAVAAGEVDEEGLARWIRDRLP